MVAVAELKERDTRQTLEGILDKNLLSAAKSLKAHIDPLVSQLRVNVEEISRKIQEEYKRLINERRLDDFYAFQELVKIPPSDSVIQEGLDLYQRMNEQDNLKKLQKIINKSYKIEYKIKELRLSHQVQKCIFEGRYKDLIELQIEPPKEVYELIIYRIFYGSDCHKMWEAHHNTTTKTTTKTLNDY
ncbi:MAG: hypothetical protein ACP5KK_02640 [Candidatus Nanoarchaeia archaeon]